MSGADSGDPPLGERLLAMGWDQGALFTAPSACFAWNGPPEDGRDLPTVIRSRQLKSKERLVLISQACDIVAAVGREPYVEALICTVESRQDYLDSIDRNSARWFVVDRERGLVAQAKYRVIIAKDALEQLRPEPWSGGRQRHDRFVRWLARRYDRPAIPDELVRALQNPLQATLDRLSADDSRTAAAFGAAVHEVRITMPVTVNPPFDIQLVLLIERDALNTAEAEAIGTVVEAIRAVADPDVVRLDPEVRILSDEEMSVREYFDTRPLFLDHLTYRGEEIEGAEPYGTP